MLEIVTFTGVDSTTELAKLTDISKRYPIAEFGILVGTRTSRADGGIFPALDLVERFRDHCAANGIRSSLHLCGEWSRSALGRSDVLPYLQVLELAKGFGRLQINLHGDFFGSEWIEPRKASVLAFVEDVRCDQVILQHRLAWSEIPVTHEKVEYLFDRSGGRGETAFHLWPEPPAGSGERFGYAGGIGPAHIHLACNFIRQYPDHRLWIDMEGRIRRLGWLDLDAVEEVLDIATRSL